MFIISHARYTCMQKAAAKLRIIFIILFFCNRLFMNIGKEYPLFTNY